MQFRQRDRNGGAGDDDEAHGGRGLRHQPRRETPTHRAPESCRKGEKGDHPKARADDSLDREGVQRGRGGCCRGLRNNRGRWFRDRLPHAIKCLEQRARKHQHGDGEDRDDPRSLQPFELIAPDRNEEVFLDQLAENEAEDKRCARPAVLLHDPAE